MNLKTPEFEKSLEEYFAELELDKKGGQERTCRFSGKKFYVTSEDIKFYKKIRVPLPTLSPHERMRRKVGFINISNLFFVKSAATGKKIISCYPSSTPYKIYEHTIWDDMDTVALGMEYVTANGFFQQYKKFQLTIPRPNLDSKKTVNSNFCNSAIGAKNCYLSADIRDSEDSAHSEYLENAKNTHHSFGSVNTDVCYDSLMIQNSHTIFYSEFLVSCMNSSFLFDCRNCSDCFMCTNLRHKKYCFENKQLSKEAYSKKIEEVNLGNRSDVAMWKAKFQELKRLAIHRANHNEKSVNCTGDYINSSKDCYSCFYILASQNCAYSLGGVRHRDSYDVLGGHDTELSYEILSYLGNSSYNVKFSGKVDNTRDSEYCDLCKNCNNCFACIGLKNKSFCIFNKQYSEEEYWMIVDNIKTKMLSDGEYGELFPPEISPIPYNISTAVSYGGYDDIDTARDYGYNIEDIQENIQNVSNEISVEEVVLDIKDIKDDILQKAIIGKNNKRFRYTKEELEFHRKYKLALPIEHYTAMLAKKRISIGPIDFNIKYRRCVKCHQKTQSTFPEDHPDAPLNVYCEKCYNKEVN